MIPEGNPIAQAHYQNHDFKSFLLTSSLFCRLYLHRITASVIPLVLMLKSELHSFPDDAKKSAIPVELCCSLEPAWWQEKLQVFWRERINKMLCFCPSLLTASQRNKYVYVYVYECTMVAWIGLGFSFWDGGFLPENLCLGVEFCCWYSLCFRAGCSVQRLPPPVWAH